MQQAHEMKVIVLTWGDLTDAMRMFDFRIINPRSDARLNGQESAEAIVPRRIYTQGEGLNIDKS
jgi:hypothetical protein